MATNLSPNLASNADNGSGTPNQAVLGDQQNPPLNDSEKLDLLISLFNKNKSSQAALEQKVVNNEKRQSATEKALKHQSEVIAALKVNSHIIWQQSTELAAQVHRTHTFVENKTDEILKDTQETLREARNVVLWQLKLADLEEFAENDDENETIFNYALAMVKKRLPYIEPIDIKAKKTPSRDGDSPEDFRMMISFLSAGDANKFKARLNNEGYITCRNGMSKMVRSLCSKYKVLAERLNANEQDPNIEYRTKYQFSIACHTKGNPDDIKSVNSSINPSSKYKEPNIREVALHPYPRENVEEEVHGDEMRDVSEAEASEASESHKRKRSENETSANESQRTKRLRELASQDVRLMNPLIPPNGYRDPHPQGAHDHHPRHQPPPPRGNHGFQQPWRGGRRGWRNHTIRHHNPPYGGFYDHHQGPPPKPKGRGRPPKSHPFNNISRFYSTNRTPRPVRHPVPNVSTGTSGTPSMASSVTPSAAASSSASTVPSDPEVSDSTNSNRGSASADIGPLSQLSQAQKDKIKKVPVTFVSFDNETLTDSLRNVYKKDMAMKLHTQNYEMEAQRLRIAQLTKELELAKQVTPSASSTMP